MADNSQGDPEPPAEENEEDQQSKEDSVAGRNSEPKRGSTASRKSENKSAEQEGEGDGEEDQRRSTNKRASKRPSKKDDADKEDQEDGEKGDGTNNLAYALQISRAALVFLLGCCVTWEFTGVCLWKSLERRI